MQATGCFLRENSNDMVFVSWLRAVLLALRRAASTGRAKNCVSDTS